VGPMIYKSEIETLDQNGVAHARFDELDAQFFQDKLRARFRTLWNKCRFLFHSGLEVLHGWTSSVEIAFGPRGWSKKRVFAPEQRNQMWVLDARKGIQKLTQAISESAWILTDQPKVSSNLIATAEAQFQPLGGHFMANAPGDWR